MKFHWGLIHYFSAKKLVNATLVLLSFYSSRFRKSPKMRGMPISLSIEPTTSCNLRCPQCPSGLRSFTRATGMLDNELFRQIIDEQSATLLYLTFYFQGEPFLNPSFFEMVNYAHRKKIYVSTSTNAHYLNKENAEKTVKSGLDKLIISLDGITQQSYQKYRVGGNLDAVLAGIDTICQAKKELKSAAPHVIVQFIIFKHNENEIADIIQRFSKTDVELQLKTAQIYDYENGSDLIPENENFSRYNSNGNAMYSIKNQHFNHCWKMWHSSVITWNGKIVPCCFDKDAHYQLGDIQNNSFATVWKSIAYNNFRKQLLTNRKEIDICKNCTEGSRIYI
ncbi:MAG: SPASM domain-containing protein [Cytophagales bacterium]